MGSRSGGRGIYMNDTTAGLLSHSSLVGLARLMNSFLNPSSSLFSRRSRCCSNFFVSVSNEFRMIRLWRGWQTKIGNHALELALREGLVLRQL